MPGDRSKPSTYGRTYSWRYITRQTPDASPRALRCITRKMTISISGPELAHYVPAPATKEECERLVSVFDVCGRALTLRSYWSSMQ